MPAAPASPPSLHLVPPGPRSDGELCARFLAGEQAAFGELVARHQAVVQRLVRRYAGSPDEVRDLSQRAFLQALTAARRVFPRLARGPQDALPFRAWLLRIAVNLGKNAARDRTRWMRAPVEAVDRHPSPGPSAPVLLEQAQAEARVRQAVLGLPRRQREVFGLRIDGGLPFAEIARTLGITEGNAKTHFHYAVKRLKQEVGAQEDQTP